MKIAITGHTAGIGKAFADRLSASGHDIIGLSKREGNNIRVIPKITSMIEPCDFWINNAQSGYAQTELLYKVWECWRNVPGKMIWVISTTLTMIHKIPTIPGISEISLAEYKNQKRALEDAFYQLKSQPGSPQMVLIRPGRIATQPGQIPDQHGADVVKWADAVIDFYRASSEKNLLIEEISLGFNPDQITI